MKARFNQRNWCAHEIDTLHIPCLRVYLGDDAGFYFIYTGSFTLDSCFIGFVRRVVCSLLDGYYYFRNLYYLMRKFEK